MRLPHDICETIGVLPSHGLSPSIHTNKEAHPGTGSRLFDRYQVTTQMPPDAVNFANVDESERSTLAWAAESCIRPVRRVRRQDISLVSQTGKSRRYIDAATRLSWCQHEGTAGGGVLSISEESRQDLPAFRSGDRLRGESGQYAGLRSEPALAVAWMGKPSRSFCSCRRSSGLSPTIECCSSWQEQAGKDDYRAFVLSRRRQSFGPQWATLRSCGTLQIAMSDSSDCANSPSSDAAGRENAVATPTVGRSSSTLRGLR